MSIPKICGLEQEYAIFAHGVPNFDPIHASYLVVNSIDRAADTIWDYAEETPFVDARGFSYNDAVTQISSAENLKINNLLTNGARFYVDHAHPEFSTAECLGLLDLIAFDRAGERILNAARERASSQLGRGQEILIVKNNSDHMGNSYGCHENYLVTADLYQRLFPEADAAPRPTFGVLIPFFVTRQILCGAGKVGSENGTGAVDFQISQRSDFFEITLGANTTANRPIVNTRDEPHADRTRFRRLHVIVGDANMCEVASLLKIGTTRLVLQMLEDEAVPFDFALENPVKAIVDVSHDPSLRTTVRLDGGRAVLPLEVQREFLAAAELYCAAPEHDTGENRLVLSHWRRALDGLERDPMELDGSLDWVTKYRLLERRMRRKGLGWRHPRVRRMDILYHDIRPGTGLFRILESRGRVRRVLDGEARVKYFVNNPPEDTRAYFRSQCLRRFGEHVAEANWDVLSFDVDGSGRTRVPLPDPAKGTRELVEGLLEESAGIEQFLANLQS